MNHQPNKFPSLIPGISSAVQRFTNSPCFVIHVLNCPRRQSVRCQSVVERNRYAAGGPWAALDNAAYICFKREMAPFVLHDLHSIDPLQEKTPVSPRGRVIGLFFLLQAQCGEGREPSKE